MMRRARARGDSSIQEGRIWSILVQMLLGLHYLHSRRVLHRDMKTANVFLTTQTQAEGRLIVKIGDLGVAKLLGTGKAFAETMVGTPYYLSPELVQDQPYNGQSDLWALGIILYECCTLKRPFEASNQCALILKIVRGEYAAIPPENASSALIEITNRLLERDPLQRPSTQKLLSLPVVQQQLLGLGFELPPEIRVADESSSGMRTPRRQSDDSNRREVASPSFAYGTTGNALVSSRLESLARPRPVVEPAAPPQPVLKRGPSSVPQKQQVRGGRVRGGRVRGGGQRQVSQRAQKKPEGGAAARGAATQKADYGNDGDDKEEVARRSMQSSANWHAPVIERSNSSRPTVADLLAKQHEDRRENSEPDAAKHDVESSETAVSPALASALNSPSLEAKNSIGEGPSTPSTLGPLLEEAPAVGEDKGAAKMEVLGWAAQARAKREADWQSSAPEIMENADEEEEDDGVDEDYGEDWENDSDEGGRGAGDSEIDDRDRGQAEEQRRDHHEESFSALAKSTWEQCNHEIGEDEFGSLYREMAGILARTPEGGAVDDAQLDAFYHRATSACGDDRYRAQHIIFCIQKIMAAEAGLKEEREFRARGEDTDSKDELGPSMSLRSSHDIKDSSGY